MEALEWVEDINLGTVYWDESQNTFVNTQNNGPANQLVSETFEVLRALPKLHKLYLHDNQIDDEGARALAKTIAFCHEEVACLRFLYLANNRITKAGKAAIAEAVAKRNRITVFYEDSRPVSPGPA